MIKKYVYTFIHWFCSGLKEIKYLIPALFIQALGILTSSKPFALGFIFFILDFTLISILGIIELKNTLTNNVKNGGE